jgi:transcriptional regulator with XRE-family HTH domain
MPNGMACQYPSVLAVNQRVGHNSRVSYVKYKTPLDRYMAELDIGDTELHRLTGVPQPTITRYRNGTRKRAHEEILARLGDGLGVTVAELQGKDIGDQLPPEAVKIARLWLSLLPGDRKKFRTILEAFQPAAPDKQVSKHIPSVPAKSGK